MQKFEYQAHLNRVSRSFALAITFLENPLQEWVSMSYLLCRILDTIEDAPWPADFSVEALAAYQQFKVFLTTAPSSEEIEKWRASFPTEIPEGEKLLLDDIESLLANFHRQPVVIQSIIRKPVLSMARGMVHYTRQKNKGALILKSLSEVNQYCLFVAGVVGELLENLFHASAEQSKGSERTHKNLLQAYHFGLFLQKVNILKDQWSDEKEGRFFVPHRQALLKSVVVHARNAVDYLKSIGQPDMGYRLFCAFSLFLGIATLPALSQAAGINDANKISRQEAKELMGQLQSVIHSNEEVEKMYVDFISQMSGSEDAVLLTKTSNLEVTADTETAASLHNLYEGEVSSEEWKKLVN